MPLTPGNETSVIYFIGNANGLYAININTTIHLTHRARLWPRCNMPTNTRWFWWDLSECRHLDNHTQIGDRVSFKRKNYEVLLFARCENIAHLNSILTYSLCAVLFLISNHAYVKWLNSLKATRFLYI